MATLTNASLPEGVIFDMDGVLLDSEPFICKAACMMFAERGLAVKPEDFLPFVGAGENRYIGGVAEKYGLPEKFILFVGTLEPRKNLVTLIKAFAGLKKRGIPHRLVVVGKEGWLYDPV